MFDVIVDEDVDNEEVYKMANVMSHCGGLKVMLKSFFLLYFSLVYLVLQRHAGVHKYLFFDNKHSHDF